MARPTKKLDLCAGKPYGSEGKKFWIKAGTLIEWDDGGYSVELDAVPVGPWFDGRLSAFEQRERGERSQGGGSGGTRGGAPQRDRPARATDAPKSDDFQDDDIPFLSMRDRF